jgi:D-sedoheptulose 7-phosphate isomerase
MKAYMKKFIDDYRQRLHECLSDDVMDAVPIFADSLKKVWNNKNTLFVCGNGGSAGNAIHIANDFIFGIDKHEGLGIKVDALPANQAVLSCLANDIGYENIFSHQLKVKGSAGDVLLVLSGSGNSDNIINAVTQAKKMNIKTFGILGFDGGKCLSLLDVPIHFKINDMQISEDLQLIICHMCMQWLSKV